VTDADCERVDASALSAYKATLLRVRMRECRFTGAEFAEAQFQDCVFCNAKLTHVTFDDCDLAKTNFTSATCDHVDISGEDLRETKGILGLKGSVISAEQLIQLAPFLASELGFHVKE
jgi:uncharacterized protein YjbI with pentapeptide repeats